MCLYTRGDVQWYCKRGNNIQCTSLVTCTGVVQDLFVFSSLGLRLACRLSHAFCESKYVNKTNAAGMVQKNDFRFDTGAKCRANGLANTAGYLRYMHLLKINDCIACTYSKCHVHRSILFINK